MTQAHIARSSPLTASRPRYLALCARHTEPLVAAELIALPDVADVEVRTGSVAFSGPRAALYRANLYSRCASRILRVLGDYACGGPTDLYDAVRSLPWEDFVEPTGTLAVSAMGEAPGLSNSMFTALKTKDAVVDRFRDRLGQRPDIDTQRPELKWIMRRTPLSRQAAATLRGPSTLTRSTLAASWRLIEIWAAR